MSDGKQNKVRVARIGKPHGIRGEVTVELFTDSPETRFARGNMLQLLGQGHAPREFTGLTIERARWNKKVLLLKFIEFSDRNTAESLRDSELYAPAQDPLDDEPGWYADELIGFSVHSATVESPTIGKVSDLITGTAQDLLQIQLADGRRVLIPFVEEIVPEVNNERGAIIITPPPGLLELNHD